MPKWVVHLHEDVFYDIEVEADDADKAEELARDKIYTGAVSHDDRTAGGFELADCDEPVELVTNKQKTIYEGRG